MENFLKPDKSWLKLDNAAKIYPAIQGAKDTCVFRMAANMKDAVDPVILQQALIDLKPRFPSIYVRLRRGFFWYYFEENKKTPKVYPEGAQINKAMDPFSNNYYLFTVLYYKNRISLEFFHSLGDGTGAITFLKALVYHYLELKGNKLFDEGLICVLNQPYNELEVEDSFNKNVSKTKKTREDVKTAYHIKAKPFARFQSRGIINGKVSGEALRQLSRKSDATITQFMTALLTYSIWQTYGKKIPFNKPINVGVPINLRKFYPSISLRNFTLFFHSSVYNTPYLTFEAILAQVKATFAGEVQLEKLQQNINANVMAERNIALRMAPLYLKKIALMISGKVLGARLDTATISNLGIVTLPESMGKHIQDFEFNLTTDAHAGYGIGVITFNDITTISFLRSRYDTRVEQKFFAYLAEHGLKVEIETNRWEEVA